LIRQIGYRFQNRVAVPIGKGNYELAQGLARYRAQHLPHRILAHLAVTKSDSLIQ
jgi:hypothetical protein